MILIQVLISLAAFACLIAIVKPFGLIKTRGQATLAFLGFCALNVIVAVGGPQSKSSASQSQPSIVQSEPTKSAMPSQGDAPKQNWVYTSSTDEMTGVVRKLACTTSTNELHFAFPYSGGSSGELCFRKKGNDLSAWVTISSGQFICGVEDCSLHLKFDDGSVQSFAAGESTTHESNMLFIESAAKLLANTKRSYKLKLQADYYQEGSQVLQFDLEGIDPSKL